MALWISNPCANFVDDGIDAGGGFVVENGRQADHFFEMHGL